MFRNLMTILTCLMIPGVLFASYCQQLSESVGKNLTYAEAVKQYPTLAPNPSNKSVSRIESFYNLQLEDFNRHKDHKKIEDNCIKTFLTMEGAKDVFRTITGFSLDESKELETSVIAPWVGSTSTAGKSGIAANGFNFCGINKVKKEDCDELMLNTMSNGFLSAAMEMAIKSQINEDSAKRYDQMNCQCLVQKYGKITDAQFEDSKKELNEFLLRSASQKLINDFSRNYESALFYINTNPAVLGLAKDKQGKVSEGLPALCLKGEPLNKVLKKSCRLSFGEDWKVRATALLKAAGINTSGKKDLEEILVSLGTDISRPIKEDGSGVSGKSLERVEYDKLRYSMNKESPEVSFIDFLLTEILQDAQLKESFSKKIGKKENAERALETMIAEMSPERTQQLKKNLLNRFASKSFSDKARIEELINFPTSLKELSGSIAAARNLNPAIGEFLRSKELREAVAENLTQNQSVLSLLESNKSPYIFKQELERACEKFREEFAELACVEPDELIERTPKNKIAQIISASPDHKTSDVIALDQVVCKVGGKKDRKVSSFFSEVAESLSEDSNFSEYYIENYRKDLQSSRSKLVAKVSKDKQAEDEYGKIAKAHASSSSSIPLSFESYPQYNALLKNSTDNRQALRFSSDAPSLSDGSHYASPTPIRNESVVDNSLIKPADNTVPSSSLQTPTASFTQTNYDKNFVTPSYVEPINRKPASQQTDDEPQPEVSDKTSTGFIKQNKQELIDLLGTGAKKEVVKDQVSQIDDAQVSELLKLKEERERDKKTISDLQLAAERKETERLRQEYQGLEQKYQALLKGQATAGQATGGSSFGGSDKLGGSNSVPAQDGLKPVDESLQPQQAGGLANFNASRLGQNATGESRPPQVKVDKGAITVELKQQQGVAREDEVYKILENTNDGQVLEEIQKTGVTYKYEVVVNNKIQVVEEKIPFKDLNPKLQELVKKKLEQIQQVALVEAQVAEAKRKYAAQALRLELLMLDKHAKRRVQ